MRMVMRAADIFQNSVKHYRKSINPPYKKKDIYPILGTILLLLLLPLITFFTNQVREPSSKAASVRGQPGDLWADVVIGKRDFTEITPGFTNPQRAVRPGGVVVDTDTTGSTLGRMWVWSGQESRIVGLNLDNCENALGDCTGEKVIGQSSLSDHAACNGDSSFQNFPNRVAASASSLCGVTEAALSTAENLSFIGMYTKSGNLYVPDLENHRILVYYSPWSTDSVADEVLGQDSFSGVYCNKSQATYLDTQTSASSLCLIDYSDTARAGAGLTLDGAGNLWVADNGNNRVLRFRKNPSTGKFEKAADIVLGQTSFVVGPRSEGSGLYQLRNPNTLRFDSNANLYVSDAGNSRILKFTPAQQVTGSAGSVFAAVSGFIGDVDQINGGIWVQVNGPPLNRLLLYNFSGALVKTLNTSQLVAGSLGVDKQGNLLVSSPTQGMLLFKNPLAKGSNQDLWDKNFLKSGWVNNSRLNTSHGVAIAGNQLFVSDRCRVLVWNDPGSLTNGKPADFVLIQSSFTSFDCNVNYVGRIKSDSYGRVYLKTRRGVYIYQTPVTSASQPVKIISDPISTLGGQTLSVLYDYEGLMGIAPQKINGQLFLWVADTNNSRVVRLRDPLGTPKIDVIIGQINTTETACNRGQSFPNTEPPLNYLCRSGSLSIDNFGNLYISDHSLEVEGNHRILMFTAGTFPAANPSLQFNFSATKAFPRFGPMANAAWETAFDSQNRMVAGFNAYIAPRFVGYYLNPLDPNKTVPDGYFKDFVSGPYGSTFDAQGNLYVTDINRNRVLIYKTPLSGLIGNSSDLNSDGKVDVFDLSILLSNWGSTNPQADINNSGLVDIFDLSTLLSTWTP